VRLTARLTICVDRWSGIRIKVENSDEALRTPSKTATGQRNHGRSRSNQLITGSFSDYSEAMESAGNSTWSEVKAIIEAAIQLDATIKTKIASSDIPVYAAPSGAIFIGETLADELGEDGTSEEGGERRINGGDRIPLAGDGQRGESSPETEG